MGILRKILLESKRINSLEDVLNHYNIDKSKHAEIIKIFNNRSKGDHSRDIMISKLIGNEDFKKLQYWWQHDGYIK